MAGPKPNIQHPLQPHVPPLAAAWGAWPAATIGQDSGATCKADRLEAMP